MGVFGLGATKETPSIRKYLRGLFWHPPAGYASIERGANGVPDYREMKRLMKTGADVDERAGSSETALHMAVDMGDADLVDFLLAYKPRLNVRDCENPDDLHYYGSKLNKGYAPLHIAIAKSDYGIAERLLKSGADPNYKTYRNENPLDLAAKCPSPEMTELLLASGAIAPDRIANRVGKDEIEESVRALLDGNRIEVREGDWMIPAFSSAVVLATLSDMGFETVSSDHRTLRLRSGRYWAECECDVDADSVSPWVESFFTSMSLGFDEKGERFARITPAMNKRRIVS